MRTYIQRPIEVKAIQFDGTNGEEISEFTDSTARALASHTPLMMVTTPNGDVPVRKGDWVVIGVKGMVQPVSDGVFQLTYQPSYDEMERIYDEIERIANEKEDSK